MHFWSTRVFFLQIWVVLSTLQVSFAQIIIPEDLDNKIANSDTLDAAWLQPYPDTSQVRFLNQLFEKYQPNNPGKAISLAIAALEISQEIDYPLGIANSLNNIGVINKIRGEFDKALEGYLKALNIFRREGEHKGEAKTLSNMGNIYSSLSEPEKALEFFLEADTIFSSLHDTTRLVGLYNNIGNAYFDLGDEEMALKYYFQALELYSIVKVVMEREVPFNPYSNIGQIYFARQDYDSALYCYERSLLIERKQNRRDGEALALNNMGIVYRKMGELDRSLEFHNLALDFIPQLDNKQTQIRIYRGLVDAYFIKGEMFLTYFYLDQESKLKDSLYQEEANRILANIELNRLLDQKQNEIDVLIWDGKVKDLEIELNRTTTILLILIALTALAVVALIYLRYLQNKRVTKTLETQNRQIQEQNRLIEDKNQSITEGIEYAKSLQEAVVNRQLNSDCFAEAFVFHRPKDIVSGDFYFYAKAEGYEILAVADCTGHGVAGAFMTVIGNAILNQIILEHKITNPAQILRQLDNQLAMMLRLQGSESEGRGMDISIIRIDPKNREVTFSGAKRPLLYFQQGKMHHQPGSRVSIGDTQLEKLFENITIPYRAGDTFYLYSDGYADQFGGRQDRKFMRTRFRALLEDQQAHPLDEQMKNLGTAIQEWMGRYHEQTDDMLVVGLRF